MCVCVCVGGNYRRDKDGKTATQCRLGDTPMAAAIRQQKEGDKLRVMLTSASRVAERRSTGVSGAVPANG